MRSAFLSLPYWLRLGLAAAGFVVTAWVMAAPDARGRAACELRLSPGTCTHVLRGG